MICAFLGGALGEFLVMTFMGKKKGTPSFSFGIPFMIFIQASIAVIILANKGLI